MAARTAEGKLFQRIQSHDKDVLMLNTVDGVLWATNGYWAVAVPDGSHAIAKMLRLFNLDFEPARLSLLDALHPSLEEKPLPDIAKQVHDLPDDLAPIRRRTLHGTSLYGFDGDRPMALYDLPGGRILALNNEYRSFVEAMAVGEWYGGPDPLEPVYLLDEGKPTALLMGVRCQASAYEPAVEADVITATGA